jgi:hypothetical protein
MKRKDSSHSPAADGPGQVREVPTTPWSPAQEDISNRDVKNPDLSEEDRDAPLTKAEDHGDPAHGSRASHPVVELRICRQDESQEDDEKFEPYPTLH